MIKTETYTLPAFWASALINADTSGLEDSEEQALNAWLDNIKPGCCIYCSEAPFFTKCHDAGNYVLACDCLNFTFQVVS